MILKLSSLVDAMEMECDELHHYIHKETGEIVQVSEEDMFLADDGESLDELPDWQREDVERAEKVLFTEDYIQLPTKYDIHDYRIMEQFCLSLTGELGEIMYSSIKGSGAFRRFKDNIIRYDIEDEWYKFKEDSYYDIAAEWCESHSIPYIDDRKS